MLLVSLCLWRNYEICRTMKHKRRSYMRERRNRGRSRPDLSLPDARLVHSTNRHSEIHEVPAELGRLTKRLKTNRERPSSDQLKKMYETAVCSGNAEVCRCDPQTRPLRRQKLVLRAFRKEEVPHREGTGLVTEDCYTREADSSRAATHLQMWSSLTEELWHQRCKSTPVDRCHW